VDLICSRKKEKDLNLVVWGFNNRCTIQQANELKKKDIEGFNGTLG
jgi:hypothetical protein